MYWVSPKFLRPACHCVWLIQGLGEHKVHMPDGQPECRATHRGITRVEHILPKVGPPELFWHIPRLPKAAVMTYLGKTGLFTNCPDVPVALAFQCASGKGGVWSGSEITAQAGQAFANLQDRSKDLHLKCFLHCSPALSSPTGVHHWVVAIPVPFGDANIN